jgi:hypothetical protein
MRRYLARVVCIALVLASACFLRSKPGEEATPRPPIPVRVRNDNFLDVNVYASVGSASRRLGTVTGNSTAMLTIDWPATGDQPIVLTAIPIGGGGARATSPAMQVGQGQMIFFTVGSVLRQSTATVGDPSQVP